MRQSSATDLGDVFVTALVDGDVPRLAGTLAPDVQMRALIPPGPIEVLGAEAVSGKFAAWFEQHLLCAYIGGRITALDLICSGFRPDYTAS